MAQVLELSPEMAQKFKAAVETGKMCVETEHVHRQSRLKELEKLCEGQKRDFIEQTRNLFTQREERAVLAKCKMLTTADFESLQVLGEGSFGVVHLVRFHNSEEYYALKQMSKSKTNWNDARRKNVRDGAFRELQLLREAQSQWIVTLYDTFQDTDNIYTLMEFVQGGDLMSYLIKKKRLNMEETQFYMAELCEALDTVHQSGFVHRDVKPDNMMLTAQGHLKLLDFGLCRYDPNIAIDVAEAAEAARLQAGAVGTFAKLEGPRPSRTRLKSCLGTPQYMAPEVYLGSGYGIEADFWSLGIVTFECLVGYVPFHAGSVEGPEGIKIIRRYVKSSHQYLPVILQHQIAKGSLNSTAAMFIHGALCADRQQRLTAEQIRRDCFFFNIDFKRIHLSEPPIVPPVAGPNDATNFNEDDWDQGRELPEPTPYVAKDMKLDFPHYEYDRTAYNLQRPTVDPAEYLQPCL